MKTIYELEKEIEKIREVEREKIANGEKLRNYDNFNNRFSDWVIGKAHADIGLTNINGNWQSMHCTIGGAISISGNCGTSYKATAQITGCTDTFFHNVWTDKQRKRFQEKLNKVALKEIQKTMGDLHSVLEIMGLQATSYYLETLYPEDKIQEIKKEIWKETIKTLNTYTDREFKRLEPLSHGNQILNRYLTEKRPKLLTKN